MRKQATQWRVFDETRGQYVARTAGRIAYTRDVREAWHGNACEARTLARVLGASIEPADHAARAAML